MARSALTGTEKKVKKSALKTAKERDKLSLASYKKGLQGLEGISRGQGLLPESIEEISKRLAPQRNESLRQFEQLYATQLRTQYGASSGQGSRSSAMTQALAAARGNLESQIQSDLANMSNQNQLTNLNARMQSYGALSGQGMTPVSQALSQQSSYLPKSNNPSTFRKIMAGGSTIAGTVGGAMIGGPAGAAVGAQAGNAVGQMWL
jgi:hypothetical protein